MLTLAEYFAGIGGWSEAALMAGGIKPVYISEIDTFKNKVYELRHPGVPNFGDIHHITHPPHADIFTISFPCTGVSVAGKGRGLADPNSRLWFEAERVICVGRPKYCIIENGPALTTRGLDRILYFFASIGYDAEWTCLQGWQFGIQQRRKRLFLIAYPSKGGFQGGMRETTIFRQFKTGIRLHPAAIYPGWAGRWDIPEPRTYRSAYDIPGGVHRLVCTGDAIIPIVGMYVLECVKRHYHKYNI